MPDYLLAGNVICGYNAFDADYSAWTETVLPDIICGLSDTNHAFDCTVR